MRVVRILAGVAVLVAMGIAILGIAQGSSAFEGPAPSAPELRASATRVAAGNADVQAGRSVFADAGCGRCHALAAVDADGKLGPRLDQLPIPADAIIGYVSSSDRPADNIMPRDYAERLSPAELRQLAALIRAASGP